MAAVRYTADINRIGIQAYARVQLKSNQGGNNSMSHKHISPRELSLSNPLSRIVLFRKLLSFLFYVFLTITALALFIPF